MVVVTVTAVRLKRVVALDILLKPRPAERRGGEEERGEEERRREERMREERRRGGEEDLYYNGPLVCVTQSHPPVQLMLNAAPP